MFGEYHSLERFYQIPQGNGAYLTVPIRYQHITPFHAENVSVFQAFDTVTRRYVVIKKVVLPDSFADDTRPLWKRAQRELYCMLHIENDNVVKLYSCFTPAQKVPDIMEFYIVREWMSGTMRMLTPRALSSHTAVKSVFFDICRGVQCLHSMNISHRNLKPQNILVRKEGDVKLCDFGHANWEDPRADTPYIVQRYYRAPEIIVETLDKNKVSVDIWSLGCIFAELLTGRVLFPGQDHIDQFLQIVNFLGSPDPQFYQLMNEYARRFLLHRRVDEIPIPPAPQYRFPDHEFQGTLSQEPEQCELARDLLFRMLVINPDYRINIQTVLTHPYLTDVWEDCDIQEQAGMLTSSQFLKDFFEFQPFVEPAMMKEEIFNKIKAFEGTFNIFTGSKN